MIFVTVGSQMAFDRLIRAVDGWAKKKCRRDVFAQVGLTSYRPESMAFTSNLTPVEYRSKVESASLIVAHAGMGSVLTAMEMKKPLLVMPRRGHLNETRNDHQFAILEWLAKRPGVFVATDEIILEEQLDNLANAQSSIDYVPPIVSENLIFRIKSFIDSV